MSNKTMVQITCDLCFTTIVTECEYHPENWLNIRIESFNVGPKEDKNCRPMKRGESQNQYCPKCVSSHTINELAGLAAKSDLKHGQK